MLNPSKKPAPSFASLRLAVLLLLAAGMPLAALGVRFANEAVPRCRYSVRDVAFVNVHGKSWQLQLIKPADVTDEQFELWNGVLKTKLKNSNVGFIWLAEDSQEAEQFSGNETGNESRKQLLPRMQLTGPNDRSLPVEGGVVDNEGDLERTLDSVLTSTTRSLILDKVVDSLCVIVLVESGDDLKNGTARETVATAIAQVEREMWTLEKPTDVGPALVTVRAGQVDDERWLLESLGISANALPSVAIVFGQGRRLGEVLSGDAISVQSIVSRAAICGSDCECDLDREWLYGQPMIHVWSRGLERAAEDSLDFDPHAAFVVAEVAQIMQKNSGGVAGQRVDLGGGLVIHELDGIGDDPTGLDAGEELESTGRETDAGDVREIEERETEGNADRVNESRDERRDKSREATGIAASIPWWLFFTLLAGMVVVFGWLKIRNHRQ